MLIGYARGFEGDGSLELQQRELERAGCERIFVDSESGGKKSRRWLQHALSLLRQGDSFIVCRLDRVGRGVKGTVDLVVHLEQNGIGLRSLDDGIDTSSSDGRIVMKTLRTLAAMERALMSERTRVGLEAARLRGRVGGRRRVMTNEKIATAKRMLASGLPRKDVAHEIGVSVPTLYRWLPASLEDLPVADGEVRYKVIDWTHGLSRDP